MGTTHHGGKVKAASHMAPTSRSRDEHDAKAHPLSILYSPESFPRNDATTVKLGL